MTDVGPEEELTGGVNLVVRRGSTVLRPTGPWTPTVHALLRHLANRGYPYSPRAHGIDEHGREVLDYIDGDIGPAYLDRETDPAGRGLISVARALRELHEATADFTIPAGARWQLSVRAPAEVICHGDLATYNCVFREGQVVGIIDFDTAHPGPRLWDLAYTAYRFVPLTTVTATEPDLERLQALCDAYGLDERGRADLPAMVVRRLEALAEHIRTQAALGHLAFQRHLAEGHAELYDADRAYVERHLR